MSAQSPDADRKKRVSFRARHRGTKEMDLILGRYADAKLKKLSGEELSQFERIISYPDTDLYLWICGRAPIPAEADCSILRDIIANALRKP
jgi:antitoxin CptB